jgi:ubiquinone/menaquinone biosynthesis C-methylase UbiE
MIARGGAIAQTLRARLFDLGALPYAFLTMQPTWRQHGRRLGALAAVGDAPSEILDLGCGPGESAFGTAEAAPSAKVVGLDVSGPMIALARARARREPVSSRCRFVQADAMALPFADARFAAVTGQSFLYLVPDARKVLAEVARVLRPGGRAVFLEPTAPGVGLPSAMWARAFGETRFVASMALWRLVSSGYGRYDEARFAADFASAGLRLVECVPSLEGLGLFGIAERAAA